MDKMKLKTGFSGNSAKIPFESTKLSGPDPVIDFRWNLGFLLYAVGAVEFTFQSEIKQTVGCVTEKKHNPTHLDCLLWNL